MDTEPKKPSVKEIEKEHAQMLFELACDLIENANNPTTPDEIKKSHQNIAAEIFLKAAKYGHVSAQKQYAELCYFGAGTPKNDILAIKWYEQAAKCGDAAAQHCLGIMCSNGEGLESPDIERAIYWLTKSVEQNYVEAKIVLGEIYLGDHDTTAAYQNHAAAVRLLGEAAAEDMEEAQYLLGMLFYEGRRDIPVDESIAGYWMLRAALLGHPDAQYIMGRMLFDGTEAIPQNRESAIKFLELAKDQGVEDATKLLEKIETPTHIETSAEIIRPKPSPERPRVWFGREDYLAVTLH